MLCLTNGRHRPSSRPRIHRVHRPHIQPWRYPPYTIPNGHIRYFVPVGGKVTVIAKAARRVMERLQNDGLAPGSMPYLEPTRPLRIFLAQ